MAGAKAPVRQASDAASSAIRCFMGKVSGGDEVPDGSRLPLSCQPATGGAPGQAVCIFPQGEGLAWLQSGLRSPRAAGAVRRAEGGALGTPRNVKSPLFRPSGTFSRKGRRTA